MAHLTKSPLPVLNNLSNSLTTLDTVLHPLLQGYTLEDITNTLQFGSEPSSSKDGKGKSKQGEGEGEGLDLSGRLDSARLQVSLAYVICDLVWIYLKTKGINTSTHPVMAELERVKGYFGKIKAVQSRDGEEAHMKLDKSAAGRFIRAALSGNDVETSSTPPQSKHTKFAETDDVEAGTTPSKTKDSAKKRNGPDPFEGYDNPSTLAKRNIEQAETPASEKRQEQQTPTTTSASESAQKKRKKKGKK